MTPVNGVQYVSDDLDAKIYFPKLDNNNRNCALIKVKTTNELSNPLILEVGGLGVVAREVKENGEIWFYVPYQVKNLKFSCKGYSDVAPIPVQLKESGVYRITLATDMALQVVQNAVLASNYLKISINEPNAIVRLGKTRDYELISTTVDGTLFSQLLDYGTYYYRVEHPLYHPSEGSATVADNTPRVVVNMVPSYGLLSITSNPSGAKVYVDNQEVGTTPCNLDTKFASGSVGVRLHMDNYYPLNQQVSIRGNGERQTEHFDLRPQFGMVTCMTDDPEAEIWVDDTYMGKGSWRGNLSSLSQHKLEVKKPGHQSQSIAFRVQDGVESTHKVNAPIPLYGNVNIVSTPVDADVKIDGKNVGTTPMITQILSGNHTVEISKNGYDTQSFQVTIDHNKTLNVNKTLSKAVVVAAAPASSYSSGSSSVTNIRSSSEDPDFNAPALMHYYNGYKSYYDDKNYSKAVKELKIAADMGLASAQHLLGRCYDYGDGVSEDDYTAVKWFKKAAEQNHPDAQFLIALKYRYGTTGYTKNISTAIEWYNKAASNGHDYSIGELIELNANPERYLTIYHKGYKSYYDDNNYDKAFELYKESANMGYMSAQFRLGYCYYYGKGVTKDEIEALRWYRKAAEQGYCQAQYNVANAYFYGTNGYPEDHTKAIEWYKKAAMGDSYYAIAAIEKLIELGVNFNTSSNTYSSTSSNQSAKSICDEALGYYNKKSYNQAFKLFEKAADMGYAEAQYRLALCYSNGNGVTKDEYAATRWYAKAAEQGHVDAMDYLAIRYTYGTYGLNKDKNKAIELYKKAARGGSTFAKGKLKEFGIRNY